MSRKQGFQYKKHKRRRQHWRNEHHLLYPKVWWGESFYGRKLREHRYFRRFIPENTLHKYLHRDVANVPVPPNLACREAYYEFMRRYSAHLVDDAHDTLERRLQVLMDLFADYPKTVEALRRQQAISIKFYKNGRL